MTQKIEAVLDKIYRFGFLISTLGLVVLYFFYDRQGRAIGELKSQAEQQLLAQKLQAVREQAGRSQDDYNEAMENYATLKRRHADLLNKLGILPDTQPNPPGNPGRN